MQTGLILILANKMDMSNVIALIEKSSLFCVHDIPSYNLLFPCDKECFDSVELHINRILGATNVNYEIESIK